RGIELADEGDSEEVHVLIGSDFLWKVLKDTNVRLSRRLVATDSIFGFVIQGSERESNCGEVLVNLLRVTNEELNCDRIKDLWELEAIGITPKREISHSDLEILEAFEQNTTYENNRYETKLLWKDNHEGLNDNYEIARRRLFNLNKRFKRDDNFYSRYKEIINTQLKDNIIEEINCELDNDVSKGYFMPHHGVVKDLKETTKLRICYSASSKANNELSLNDCLECGPNLNPDLLKIILKFRFYPIAFCADIQRAFLEVGIVEEDRKFLQFLWGEEGGTNLSLDDRTVRILRMRRVPFGVKCSPFLLHATIKLHLKKYEHLYKRTCAVLNELYVDNLITGAYCIEEAALISKEATGILSEANMNLRQWTTNSPPLLEMWNETDLECRQSDSDIPLKVLGLIWDNKNDTLKIALNQMQQLSDKIATKRVVLSACGMLFDPLGLLTPFTVRIKLLMQQLWEGGFTCDEPLPSCFDTSFREWLQELTFVQDVVVPRLYFSEMKTEMLEVHIFSDASPKAYGSVAYFRMKHPSGVRTSFILSKSRLAPLKTVSLPRLELLGALVSARLCLYLRKTFPLIKESNIFLWSDS
ncbi:hypothetical protein AVEN_240591-1, partial [Araneus ventricosus]